jgi:hypothetical protein
MFHQVGRCFRRCDRTVWSCHTRARKDESRLPYPSLPLRGVAQVARRPVCLLSASTPDVPFCAVATMMQPSFWRVVRRPIRCGRRHPQLRLPSAVPHAVRPALAASRACSCCCARNGTSGAPSESWLPSNRGRSQDWMAVRKPIFERAPVTFVVGLIRRVCPGPGWELQYPRRPRGLCP